MDARVRCGIDNPHPLSQGKTELVWEGKYPKRGVYTAYVKDVDVLGCDTSIMVKVDTRK